MSSIFVLHFRMSIFTNKMSIWIPRIISQNRWRLCFEQKYSCSLMIFSTMLLWSDQMIRERKFLYDVSGKMSPKQNHQFVLFDGFARWFHYAWNEIFIFIWWSWCYPDWLCPLLRSCSSRDTSSCTFRCNWRCDCQFLWLWHWRWWSGCRCWNSIQFSHRFLNGLF